MGEEGGVKLEVGEKGGVKLEVGEEGGGKTRLQEWKDALPEIDLQEHGEQAQRTWNPGKAEDTSRQAGRMVNPTRAEWLHTVHQGLSSRRKV